MEKMNKAKNCFSKMTNIIGKTDKIKQEKKWKRTRKQFRTESRTYLQLLQAILKGNKTFWPFCVNKFESLAEVDKFLSGGIHQLRLK